MRHAITFLAALPLAGCISFGAEPPPALLTLETRAELPVGEVRRAEGGSAVTVLSLTTPQSLSTTRVPVQSTPTTIAYVEEAQWTEQPARLFARLLGDTIAARTGRVVLGNGQALTDPGTRLGGELRHFGLDATTREAVVTFDAQIVRGEAQAVEKRRFEARVPIQGEIDAQTAGLTLNDAANQVAAQVADWVGRG
ncbi:ABC-type transport auxiliary lipoprotein family protein [Sphingomonas lenta]|uniref:ABC transporter n=1 Tax=Sphingomonas lenta TaxID=1141887 RepID=A0A2A2SGB7_9SPHN|nr:ABC-type transport auxiliary lipoprotein family protein [Sphingomonas lenta]PAX08061.1 ABC transporter [Sphingomonas lenta]